MKNLEYDKYFMFNPQHETKSELINSIWPDAEMDNDGESFRLKGQTYIYEILDIENFCPDEIAVLNIYAWND